MALAIHGDEVAKLSTMQQATVVGWLAGVGAVSHRHKPGFLMLCWLRPKLGHPGSVGLAVCKVCVEAKQYSLDTQKHSSFNSCHCVTSPHPKSQQMREH